MRILGNKALVKPVPLTPEQIRALREEARMSQSVFASLLNVTTGYLSQLERGAKRPTGPALALLHVVRRKGIEALIEPAHLAHDKAVITRGLTCPARLDIAATFFHKQAVP